MKIAICDEEQTFIKKVEQQISAFSFSEKCEFSEFNSGEELLEKYCEGRYDILILEIEMSGINGLETAKRIRIVDDVITIAFLTSYEDFAVQGYAVHAARYILKQQPEHMYKEQLASLLNEFNQKHKLFKYSNSNQTFAARLSDILFFEIYIRIIVVHTMKNNFEYYGKISDLEKEYSNDGFMKVGKSFFVNIANIRFIEKNNIVMRNNEKIILGRSVKNKVVKQYMDYQSGIVKKSL